MLQAFGRALHSSLPKKTLHFQTQSCSIFGFSIVNKVAGKCFKILFSLLKRFFFWALATPADATKKRVVTATSGKIRIGHGREVSTSQVGTTFSIAIILRNLFVHQPHRLHTEHIAKVSQSKSPRKIATLRKLCVL